MKKDLKISTTSILMIMMFIIQFIKFSYFSWYDVMKYGIIIISGMFIIVRIKIMLKKKYLIINGLAILFGALTIYSSYINRNIIKERNPFLAAIIFVTTFIFFQFFIEIIVEKKQIKKMIKIFYKTTIVITIVTDLIMFARPNLVTIYSGNYFVGTKFSVVYLHMLLIMLYLIKNNFQFQDKFYTKKLLVLSIWSIVVGIYVQCATGVVGIALLYLFIYIINKKEKIFVNPIVFIVVNIFCFMFIYFNQVVLRNPIISSFIVNVLGKDITLTSRTRIFEIVPKILLGNTTWGFGYATSYEIGMKLGGFPNTQNGILEWIWQVGLPTTIIMLIFFGTFLYLIKKRLNKNNRNKLVPIIAYIYVLTVLGSVEITIGSMYFALLILAFGISMEEDSNKIN